MLSLKGDPILVLTWQGDIGPVRAVGGEIPAGGTYILRVDWIRRCDDIMFLLLWVMEFKYGLPIN